MVERYYEVVPVHDGANGHSSFLSHPEREKETLLSQKDQISASNGLHTRTATTTAVSSSSSSASSPNNDDRNDTDSTSNHLISIDDAIERLGMGWFQGYILIASGLCFAADGMQIVLLSFLTVVLRDDWNLGDEQAAGITSALFAGSTVGTLVLGRLADRIGRRPVFLLTALEIFIFGTGSAMAPNYNIMLMMIFMIGVGVGGLTVPFDVMAEFSPSTGRGKNLLLIEYFWTFGSLFVVLVAYFTLHSGGDHWRTCVAICALPCFLSFVMGYFYVPESARWLMTVGRTEHAMAVLRHAAAVNGLDVDVVFPPHMLLAPEPIHQEATFADLLQPKWRKTVLLLWGTWFAFPFGYYGTVLATTRVFENEIPPSVDGNSNSGSYEFDYSAIFVSSAAELIGTTLVILVVDRLGRIKSQLISYSLAGISIFLLCLFASSGASRLALVAFGFSARIFEMCATCVTWVSTAEILTTEVRGMGHSCANAIGRIGSFLCPYVVQGRMPLARVGMLMLLTHAFTVVCVLQLPETKGRDMGVSARDDGEDQDYSESYVQSETEPTEGDLTLVQSTSDYGYQRRQHTHGNLL